LVSLIKHAETLISLQWDVLVITLRLAVYTLFGKQEEIWAKIFCIPKNMHSRTLMYTYIPNLKIWGYCQSALGI